MSIPDLRAFRALCDELANHLQARVAKEDREVPMEGYYSQGQQLIDRARALLAQPEPQPPAAGEVAELVAVLRQHCDDANELGHPDWAQQYTRAADLLERLAPPSGKAK